MRYNDSDNLIRKLLSGRVKKYSVIRLTYPSGNSLAVRVHGCFRDKLVGCSMQWDNSATECFDLSNCTVEMVY